MFTGDYMSIPKDLEDCVLDHIAIAVPNIEDSIQIYDDLGLKFSPNREIVESQKVITAFAQIDQNAHIELLQPHENSGPIQDFITKKGPGIHHICFRVEDVEKKANALKTKGYKLIYENPVEGAGDCLVNFIHPKSTGGVLIEISQKKGS